MKQPSDPSGGPARSNVPHSPPTRPYAAPPPAPQATRPHEAPTIVPLDSLGPGGIRARLPGELPAPFGTRYRLLKLLGQGGMGAVFLGQDAQLERPVALKVPLFTAEDGPQVLERFYREARAAATIRHPNICPVYDVGEIDGIPYLTMAFIEGKPLSEYAAGPKAPTPRQSAAIVRKLALALAEAHTRGVIHRDLKPGNIMIDQRGEPVIMDFGLARRAGRGDVKLTQQGEALGTPAYMPPEQVSGNVEAMGRVSDIYSLGVILYELLARRLPFEGDMMVMLAQILMDEPPPPSKFMKGLDPELERICLKAMAKKIPDRFATMTQLATELQNYLRGVKGTAEPAPVPKAPAAGPAQPQRPGFNVSVMGGLRSMAHLPVPLPTPAVGEEPPRKRRPKQGKPRRGIPLWVWITGPAAAVLLVVGLIIYKSTNYGPQRQETTMERSSSADVPDLPGSRQPQAGGELGEKSPPPLNALSEEEKAAGWKLLFDGQTTAGWRGYNRPTVPDLWQVKDGALVLLPKPNTARCDLISKDEFDDFALALEWKIAPGGDSGVRYRVAEIGTSPHLTGPEYQILDNENYPGRVFPNARAGACVDLYAPTRDAARPAGEWNQTKIVVHGNHVEHWLNGELVVTYEVGSSDWEKRLQSSKFKGLPRFAKEPIGYIALQDAGYQVAFRNIKIQSLSSAGIAGRPRTAPAVGKPIRVFRDGHPKAIAGLAISADGRWLISGSEDGTVQGWNLETGERHGNPVHCQGAVRGMAFFPQGGLVLIGGTSGKHKNCLLLLDGMTGSLRSFYEGHSKPVVRVIFSPDGKLALSGSWDNTAKLWDVSTAKELQHFGHGGLVSGLAFHPSGRMILTSSRDANLRRWDKATGKEVGQPMRHPAPVENLSLSPDGKQVVTACWDGNVRLWDVASGREQRKFPHSNEVHGVAFLPNGRQFVSCGKDKTVRLWDAESGEEIQRFLGHTELVAKVAVTPDGRRAVSCSVDKTLILWQLP